MPAAAGVDGHLEIERGVADHQRLVGGDAQLIEESQEHPGRRLRGRFVDRPGGVEERPQAGRVELALEPDAPLRRRDAEQVAGGVQLLDDLERAREERHPVLVVGAPEPAVVVDQTLRQRLVPAREVALHGLDKAEADALADRLGRRRLDIVDPFERRQRAVDDRADRVHQRAVPVEYQQAIGECAHESRRSYQLRWRRSRLSIDSRDGDSPSLPPLVALHALRTARAPAARGRRRPLVALVLLDRRSRLRRAAAPAAGGLRRAALRSRGGGRSGGEGDPRHEPRHRRRHRARARPLRDPARRPAGRGGRERR